MRTNDARKLDRKSQETLRIRGVKAVLSGESPSKVIKLLGVNPDTVFNWLAKYREGGWENLKRRKAPGRPPTVQGRHLKWIYNMITKDPKQLKFPFALWTRKRVQGAIRERYGISLSVTSIGRLLYQLGFSCQKPVGRAYERNPVLVTQWLRKEYPKIKALARKEGARIYFGDEAGVRSDYHSGRTWSPRGETPVVKKTGKRFGLNMISAVSSVGEMRFMTVGGRMNGEVFILFLKKLILDVKRPIYLIVDGHPMHKSRKVKGFVNSTEGILKLFYLPPYSPDLNPDELVWNHLKYHCIGKLLIKTKQELQATVQSYLKSLQRKPQVIKSFFQKPSLKYAS